LWLIEWEVSVIARVSVTLIALLLAGYAFWGEAMGMGSGYIFGIMFLLLAALIWFRWEPICEAFRAAQEQSDGSGIRLGSVIMKGMQGFLHPRRRSPSS
jgi:hypothetical protein